MVSYLEPWEPVSPERQLQIEAELARELHGMHVLTGRTLHVVAARCDCDEVLCEVVGLGYAVVHMTWSGHREQTAEWPMTEMFSSLDDWHERGMKPDHDEYTLPP